MLIEVRRFALGQGTGSVIFIDGHWQCFGLEDPRRLQKQAGTTAIPAGTYQVAVRTHGRYHSIYQKRWPEFHRGMLELKAVPGFTDILIHAGNSVQDTAGCLLVGGGITRLPSGAPWLLESRAAYRELYLSVLNSALAGNLLITFLPITTEVNLYETGKSGAN